MNEIRYNVEKLFFISIYDIYLQRFYIEKYRGRVIKIKRCIDAIVSCAPLVFLTLVMLCDAKRHLWLAFASIASVIEAFSRFLPYYDKKEELEKCATELDVILGQMNFCWRKYKLDLIKVDEFQGIYERYDGTLKYTCGHSWQETDGWLVDLTGDQFEEDPSILIKASSVYVGKMDAFHRQFEIHRQEHSCGIECLGKGCWDRMYDLYAAIMCHLD